ncbi:NAD(P)/FAD-dependent oxidoreductase [Nocardia sp. NPDC049220]|uniref:flavin-containing monooxygenase n=1 Tax=Nocardia sp. NPDC049220 TaxID=3155273 RepID=UPI0033CE69C4
MRIGIIGAGIAGLATAKTLTGRGFGVTVFDRTPDLGGVWSATRRYPGLRTQNSKKTYRFSDFPMPHDYPSWPTAAQMQAYLAAYVDRFGFGDRIRLGTEVSSAVPRADGGWTLTLLEQAAAAPSMARFDHLVVANGVFSDPLIPDFSGADEFVDGGGRVCAPSEFADLDAARGRHVVVVGYGKSACDLAEAISEVAASTTVVTRRLLWKMPRTAGGGYEQLALTRIGEAMFPYIEQNITERFLHGPGRRIREHILTGIQRRVVRELRLVELGLVPHGRFEDIAESSLSLVTEGFFEKVGTGRIVVCRDTAIDKLIAEPEGTAAYLVTGQRLRADIVACATGFRQHVPFFGSTVRDMITDARGDFRLYRQILPTHVPNLTFAGYNSSAVSTLNAEASAAWIAGWLEGRIALPAPHTRDAMITQRLRWMRDRTGGHHAHGASIAPFSIRTVDETLADLGITVSPRVRARQWRVPVDPGDYAALFHNDLYPTRPPSVSRPGLWRPA